MTVNFRNSEGRNLIIYADGTKVNRYVAMALQVGEEGVAEKATLTVFPS